MLQLDNRTLLLDALRPPTDYTLDFVVGTTFSLDVLSALRIPVAFTRYQLETTHQNKAIAQLLSLEAVKRFTDRLTIFCQSGYVTAPREYPRFFAYLEDSIFEVALPDNGSFHPKVWGLRFSPENPAEPLRYRLLVLSRNLTFDRSWDTALVLDGVLTDRKLAYGAQRGLGDFFQRLPDFARSDIPQFKLDHINTIQDEIRRVKFEAPEGLEVRGFHPIFPQRRSKFPFEGERILQSLIISPFIKSSFIKEIMPKSKHTLITRLEEATAEGESLWQHFESDEQGMMQNLKVMDPDVEIAAGTEQELTEFSGLHAKLYFFDLPDRTTRIFTGSANATGAAFSKNLEFLVELSGRTKDVGIKKLLSEDDTAYTLAHIVRPYCMSPQSEESKLQKRADALLDEVRNALVNSEHQAMVEPSQMDETYALNLKLAPIQGDERIIATVRPATIPNAVNLRIDEILFKGLSIAYLTVFYEFHLKIKLENITREKKFLLKIPTMGMPEDRHKYILRSYMDSPEKFLQFLFVMLMDPDQAVDLLAGMDNMVYSEAVNGHTETQIAPGIPLFETLVKALTESPTRLDEINSIVEDLRQMPDGKSVLPENFEHVWVPLYEARKRMERTKF